VQHAHGQGGQRVGVLRHDARVVARRELHLYTCRRREGR
jgi:hypothetical protein